MRDAFAADRSRRGHATLTIDWTDWTEVGMAHAFGVQPDRGFFRSVAVDEALDLFDRLLTSATPERVFVGRINEARLRSAEGRELAALVRRHAQDPSGVRAERPNTARCRSRCRPSPPVRGRYDLLLHAVTPAVEQLRTPRSVRLLVLVFDIRMVDRDLVPTCHDMLYSLYEGYV
jgi:hypothetical protein